MAPLIDSEVFLSFSTYATVVVLKMMFMSPLTAYYRASRGAFANEEDVAGKPDAEKEKMLKPNPDVERVKRCHLNDLENVVPFVLIGLLYTLTNPELSTALLFFRIFTAARIFHTVAYITALPHVCRALSWITGTVVTFCMAYNVICYAA